ncbi:MAG TPA: dTMP kinase [Acidimicrobiia bacterium]|nr:dTMP kinase [Acidimicrobiia bacterium]
MTRRYVAFEGVDGAGKTTVAARVAERLRVRGFDVVSVREPGGTPTGEAIREILLGLGGVVSDWAEALLFAAARSQLATEVVGPALAAGRAVVSDRSVYSSLAYQGGARGLGIEAVRRVNEAGLGGIWPETVVLLRLDPGHGFAREEEANRISEAGLAFQVGVAEAYDLLAAEEPHRFVVVDAAAGLEAVVEAAATEVLQRW